MPLCKLSVLQYYELSECPVTHLVVSVKTIYPIPNNQCVVCVVHNSMCNTIGIFHLKQTPQGSNLMCPWNWKQNTKKMLFKHSCFPPHIHNEEVVLVAE